MLFELGRGGMGRVYLGRIVGAGGFERMVAIKRTHPALAQGELSERFMNEARMSAYVHHANVVGTHQAGRDEQGHYLVCDYVEGESLAGLVAGARRSGKVPPAIVARIVVDGLAGLHAAHEAMDPAGTPLHMLHRDVSADNLLVGRDGVTRLSDFGIAKSVLSPMLTEEGLRHGKLIYFPPEYLRAGPVERTLDIYAMGVTLWTGLAGQEPWENKEEAQILNAILTEGLPRLRVYAPELPPAFEAVVQRACQRDPAQRYQSAREMSVALEQLERRGAVRIATHVQVAEYVEAAIGAELVARRERVRARRLELAALPGGAAPSDPPSQSDTSTTSIDRIGPAAPAPGASEPTTSQAPASLEPASLPRQSASSGMSGAIRWFVLIAVLLGTAALGYAWLRPSSHAAKTTSPTATSTQRASSSGPRGDVAAEAEPRSDVGEIAAERVDAAAIDPETAQPAPLGPLSPARPNSAVTASPARKSKVPADEQRKPVKARPEPDDQPPGISTHNPYR